MVRLGERIRARPASNGPQLVAAPDQHVVPRGGAVERRLVPLQLHQRRKTKRPYIRPLPPPPSPRHTPLYNQCQPLNDGGCFVAWSRPTGGIPRTDGAGAVPGRAAGVAQARPAQAQVARAGQSGPVERGLGHQHHRPGRLLRHGQHEHHPHRHHQPGNANLSLHSLIRSVGQSVGICCINPLALDTRPPRP